MALTTPILYPVVAFDANNDQTFDFTSLGGDQVLGNRLVIRNNVTNEEVYNEEITTYAYRHTLEGGKITNNTYYNAVIQTVGLNGATSAFSQPIQFWCYTTPVMSITNLPQDNQIPNSEFTFEGQYSQIEGELLQQYQFNLYSTAHVLLSSSGVVYVQDNTPPPTLFNYTFEGFADASSYYIELVGETVNGTSVTTGEIEITVKYEVPNIFALIELTNNQCEGYITIRSNMVSIDGKSNPDPPIYIDDDTKVDLREPGSWVIFDEGYEINDDFTLGLWGHAFTKNSNILKLYNKGDTDLTPNRILLNFREEYKPNDDKHYCFFELWVYANSNTPYYIYSESLPYPNFRVEYAVFVRRINNVYQLEVRPYNSEVAPQPIVDVTVQPIVAGAISKDKTMDVGSYVEFRSLTVGEIDALDLTAQEFDNSGFTVWQLQNTTLLRYVKKNNP